MPSYVHQSSQATACPVGTTSSRNIAGVVVPCSVAQTVALGACRGTYPQFGLLPRRTPTIVVACVALPQASGVVGWTKLGRSATWRAQTQALYAPIRAQPCLARPANDHTPYGPYTDVCALTAQTSDTRRGLEPGKYRLYQEKISVFTADVFRPLTTPAPGWGREPGRLYRHLLRPAPFPRPYPPQLRYINGFNADPGLPTQLSSRHMSYGRADDIGNMTIGTAMASGVEGMPVGWRTFPGPSHLVPVVLTEMSESHPSELRSNHPWQRPLGTPSATKDVSGWAIRHPADGCVDVGSINGGNRSVIRHETAMLLWEWDPAPRSGVYARHSHGCAKCKSVVCTPRLAVACIARCASGFRTEAPVLTTHGCPTFAHVFARRQHAEARAAGCDQTLTPVQMI
ncbi:hypothetical protein Bbelb_397450 [Branchiostoma belcheri]|nr:hypothetical protein Bbelb_397450 [Branchiostoma belcheri]